MKDTELKYCSKLIFSGDFLMRIHIYHFKLQFLYFFSSRNVCHLRWTDQRRSLNKDGEIFQRVLGFLFCPVNTSPFCFPVKASFLETTITPEGIYLNILHRVFYINAVPYLFYSNPEHNWRLRRLKPFSVDGSKFLEQAKLLQIADRNRPANIDHNWTNLYK